MTARPQKLQSWIVRVRSTVIEDYEITAMSGEDARLRMQQGAGTLCNEVERPDWEIEKVTLND